MRLPVLRTIRQRLGFSIVVLISLSYGLILVGSEQLIKRDRLQRHERLVMATANAIQARLDQPAGAANSGVMNDKEYEIIENTLNEFSSVRVLVWLSRPSQAPILPSSLATADFTQNKQLLKIAGLNASGAQKPRLITFAGETYFTCSMPLSGGQGVLRFLEDVGVSPVSRQNNLFLIFGMWVALVLVSALIVRALVRIAISPLNRLRRAVDSLDLDAHGDVLVLPLSVEGQPAEIQPIIISYNELISRLRKAWSQQYFFLRAMSHELITPMTLISASAKRVSGKLDHCSEEISRDLALLVDESRSASHLVHDLFELSLGEAGRLQLSSDSFSVAELIAEIVSDISAVSWGSRVAVSPQSQDFAGKDFMVHCDRSMLRRCIINLLENAAKYSPEHSRVDVSIRALPNQLGILIQDHGPGVPLSEREKIFDPFYRISREASSDEATGSGIGLAFVRVMINQMGGAVKVVDGASPGACFQLTMPLAKSLLG
jgi:signal transduction histidine kinase